LKPKICFYSPAAYSYLTQKDTGTAGGAELQQVLLGKELVKKGFDISFIVDDYGQNPVELIDGIKIFRCRSNHFNGIKYLLLKQYLIWKSLHEVDADVYYHRTASPVTGLIALFCLLKKKKFVYSIAHKADVDKTLILESYLKDMPPFIGWIYKQLFKFGVRAADCIIAQNEEQKELLRHNFHRESTVIKSMHPLPDGRPIKEAPPIVLWVSSMQEFKRPELFVDLAKSIPSGRFQMIGGASSDKRFYTEIKAEARKIPNLEFIGFIPYYEINRYFEKASIFVITSIAEGFPNTILQAWARYTPVVSLNVDPDEIICRYELGFHSRTFEQMGLDVELLLKDTALREKMGLKGREYVEREHSVTVSVEKYLKVFEGLSGVI
jgi:glycosyltransferase involved in cell wall biosynthesis